MIRTNLEFPEWCKAIWFVAAAVLLFSSTAHADANDGEYLGYILGQEFAAPKGMITRDHIKGVLIYDLDAGNHPHNVDTISIYVSPKSSVIGSVFGEWYFASHRAAKTFADRYMSTLERKYDTWKRKKNLLTGGDYQLSVQMERKDPFKDRWTSPLSSRVAIGLIYAPDSLGRSEWMALVNLEVSNLELTAQKSQ